MRRFFNLLLSIVMVVAMIPAIDVTAVAATYDGFDYEIKNNEVTIVWYAGNATELDIPGKIEGYPVTSIGAFAFSNCDSLTSITMTNNVTNIGDYAFQNCISLTFVTISNQLTRISYGAFSNCDSLVSTTIPDSVTGIETEAFYSCDSLASITIGKGVTRIGYNAFLKCDSLKEIYYTRTEEDWNKISIEEQNEPLESANIHYNYVPIHIHAVVNDKAIAPTCTETGLTEGIHCLSCDEILVEQQVIEALGHSVVEDKAVLPSETKFGLTEGYHCSTCSLVFKEQELVRPLGCTIVMESDKVLGGYDDTLVFKAEGDVVTYQWYATNNEDLSKSVAVRGEISTDFSPMDLYGPIGQQSKYKYFYCVANVEINGVKLTTTSPLCLNAFALTHETDYSYIDYENATIYTDNINNVNSYEEILTIDSADGLQTTVTPSYEHKETKSYGTGSTVTLQGSGAGKTTFTIVVYGDINGDGVVDVLDTTEMSRVSTGHTTLDGVYNTAADINGDGVIDVLDYSCTVNKVLES